MFDPIACPTVTVSSAAHAAGFTLRGLRLVMGTHDRFPLLGPFERARCGWRRFTALDVVRLATLRCLLYHGFTVAEGARILDRSVDRRISGTRRVRR